MSWTAAPSVNITGSGSICGTDEETITFTDFFTTAGEKDIYIVVKNSSGYACSALKITIPEFFVPVTDITDVPAAASVNSPLTLTGMVLSADATNKTIVWTVEDARDTGATIEDGVFRATAAGTATIKATITDGGVDHGDYTETFDIVVAGIPATGDGAHTWLWAGLGALALLGLCWVSLLAARRTRRPQ